MSRVRVLVVEDSLTVRRRVVETLRADPELEVVGEAADGRTAVDLCRRLRPDVITLDMMLPQMTGVAATEQIMAHFPTPILIVSASVNRKELFRTYDALVAGAVDVLEKPRGDEPEGVWEAQLIRTVKLVARIKVIRHIRARLAPTRAGEPAPTAATGSSGVHRRCRTIALGASTGGPAALLEVLRALPVGGPVPILVVLHLAETFATAFADWLNGQIAHPVRYARDGESLGELRGEVVLAPGDRHLELRDGRLRLSTAPERHSCRPSVDVLFESLAREVGPECTAALLTGMGRDGAAGLLALRQSGARTVAQDEETSVVYGMPREAVALGAAERVLPLREIGPWLSEQATGPRGMR